MVDARDSESRFLNDLSDALETQLNLVRARQSKLVKEIALKPSDCTSTTVPQFSPATQSPTPVYTRESVEFVIPMTESCDSNLPVATVDARGKCSPSAIRFGTHVGANAPAVFERTNWPLACPPDTASDNNVAASRLLDVFGIELAGASLLVCGENRYAIAAASKQRGAVCADTQPVLDCYDVILIHDLLDHSFDPVGVLKMCRKHSDPTTRIVVRCHPWCGRHGAHLPISIPWAFAHLLLNSAELAQFNLPQNALPTWQLLHPLLAYRTWFIAAGLFAGNPQLIQSDVTALFLDPELVERVRQVWALSPMPETKTADFIPLFQMSLDFVDYDFVRGV